MISWTGFTTDWSGQNACNSMQCQALLTLQRKSADPRERHFLLNCWNPPLAHPSLQYLVLSSLIYLFLYKKTIFSPDLWDLIVRLFSLLLNFSFLTQWSLPLITIILLNKSLSLPKSGFGFYLTREIWVKVLNSTRLRIFTPKFQDQKSSFLFTPSPLFFNFLIFIYLQWS